MRRSVRDRVPAEPENVGFDLLEIDLEPGEQPLEVVVRRRLVPDTEPGREDRVVVVPDDEAETMRGGLYIPDTAKEKPTQGEVLAVGPGRIEKGERIPMEVKVGDKVLYGKYSGTNLTLEGEEVVIIKASDILAKLG